jgi:hypothetical protein
MTNPNQEPHPEELSLGEALRAIAERTAFRTEEEGSSVLAAIDKHIASESDTDATDDEPADDRAEPGDESEVVASLRRQLAELRAGTSSDKRDDATSSFNGRAQTDSNTGNSGYDASANSDERTSPGAGEPTGAKSSGRTPAVKAARSRLK